MSTPVYSYWIQGWGIKKSVIISELPYHLGAEATVRAYNNKGEDGYMITTPGPCLTGAQIDDICRKSQEVVEKQTAARSQKESDKQLKRPLHIPVLINSGSKSSSQRRRSQDRDGDSRLRRDDRRNGERR